MNQEVINEVLCQMIPHLSNDQVVLLKNVLEGVMLKNGIASEQTDEMLVDSFIAAKRLEGCSERTLTFYKNTIEKMLVAVARPMFEQIKKNQFENQYLEMLRDSLLPKLMSGELDVSDLKL